MTRSAFTFLLFSIFLALEASANPRFNGTDPSSKLPGTFWNWGKKSYLLSYDSSGTIPREVWDKYVRGPNVQSKYWPFRRGFYFCTDGLMDAVYGRQPESWVGAVHIAPECLRPEQTVYPDRLPDDQWFKDWLLRRQLQTGDGAFEYETVIRRCFRGPYNDGTYLPNHMRASAEPMLRSLSKCHERARTNEWLQVARKLFSVNAAGWESGEAFNLLDCAK